MPSTRPILALLVLASALTACEREAAPGETAPTHPVAAPAEASAPDGTVLMRAQQDPEFTTLVSAIQTAGLEETLNGPGPFTLFAPNNAAFEKISAERRGRLSSPQGRAELRLLLSYHVVPGRLDAASLMQRIQAGGGSMALTTLQGGTLTARILANGSITLTDATGGVSRIVESDLMVGNGVIHAVDTVAAPG